MPALVEASGTLKSSDLDGRCDGAMLNETGPLDGDTLLSNLSCEPTTPQYGLSETIYTGFLTIDAEVYGVNGSLEIAGREVRTIPEVIGEEVGNWAVFSSSVIACTDFYGVNYCFEYTNRSNPLRSDIERNFILERWQVRSELTRIDGKPPEILKVDGSHIQVKVEIIYSYLLPKESKVKITVEAHDAAGLDRFEFILQGEEIKQVFVTDGSLEKTVSVTFTCGVGRALGRGWDLEVKVYDRNGNGNKTSTHIDGALEGVVKALIKAFMALVEAIKELASEVFEWIWGAIKNLINSFLKPIINSIAIWIIQFTNIIKTYFERISKSFICPEGRLDSSNLIDWIEFISATLNWLFLPLMAVTMIITILNIIEIFFGILTFGVTTLSGFMIGRFITCLIISVVGMTIIEATLIMIDPTVEKFMSIAPVFNDIIGIISELATGIGLFLLELKSRSTLWRSAPIAILSIFLTAIAPFFTHGYPLLIMDIIIIIMTIISVYLFFKPLEQAAKTIAPITSTFTDGITVIAWITDPITVASHWEEWWS